jgi:hypothetical protein
MFACLAGYKSTELVSKNQWGVVLKRGRDFPTYIHTYIPTLDRGRGPTQQKLNSGKTQILQAPERRAGALRSEIMT